jgi:molybdate transport system regulatory protein
MARPRLRCYAPVVHLRYKIWLDNEGKAFGDGPYALLEGVQRTGSLSRACAELSMSYNKAWRLMREMERRLGFVLIERRTGGAEGGGSELTPEATELMRRYQALKSEADVCLQDLYRRHFEAGER